MQRLLIAWLVVLSVSGSALVAPTGIHQTKAQDTITLVPYVDVSGFSGLVPEGWVLKRAGWFQRDPFNNPELPKEESANLYQKSANLYQKVLTHDGFEKLLRRISASYGLTPLPEPTDILTTDALTWDIYALELTFQHLDIKLDVAVAQDEAHVYLVALQAVPSLYDTLHETVFLPVIHAFTPLEQLVNPTPPFVPDVWPTTGWSVSTPEMQGMDAELLLAMLNDIQRNRYPIDSVIVIRHGQIVLDAYFYPYDAQTRHALHSVTKSFTSTLIGMAVDQGYIASVDAPVLDFFPEYTMANRDVAKEALTVENLLTMTAGFECTDLGTPSGNKTSAAMRGSGNPVQFVLDLLITETPGTHFNYCNGVSHLLSAIMQQATGKKAEAFAQEYLFTPLGITDWHWNADPQQITTGWGGLMLTPHDVAKLGYLFLQQGQWDGTRIVSPEWVTSATSDHVSAGRIDTTSYGYQWWVYPEVGTYAAIGANGQRILVMPESDLVVVFMSDLGSTPSSILEGLFGRFILPSIQSDDPLPANPEAIANLEAKVEAIGR